MPLIEKNHWEGAVKRKLALGIKRMLDLVGSMCALIILSPVMFVIVVLIKLDSPGPIFFRQQRAGLQGVPFQIIKFRSMVVNADHNGPITSLNDQRVTRVGRILRLTSLDEIPQFFNVLIGEMSLVGPRALVSESINSEEMRRLKMRPGATGLVVVKGRQSLSWAQRMVLDLWYVDNWCLWLDIKIILQTIPAMLLCKGVYDSDGEMKVRQ